MSLFSTPTGSVANLNVSDDRMADFADELQNDPTENEQENADSATDSTVLTGFIIMMMLDL